MIYKGRLEISPKNHLLICLSLARISKILFSLFLEIGNDSWICCYILSEQRQTLIFFAGANFCYPCYFISFFYLFIYSWPVKITKIIISFIRNEAIFHAVLTAILQEGRIASILIYQTRIEGGVWYQNHKPKSLFLQPCLN